MNSRFSGSMGYQRLIKEIKRDTGGGGPPGPDSVGTSQIINGTITTADISDGAITVEKFSPELQLALAEFSQQLYNLEYPGFWGTFKFTNTNSSDQGAELSITVEKRYYTPVTDTYEIQSLIPVPETITKGSHYTITIPIGERLINNITIIRMYYTINKNDIAVVSNTIFEVNDRDEDNDYIDFIFDGNYDDNNGGDAEIGFTIADNI
jgi:hypothetical protein